MADTTKTLVMLYAIIKDKMVIGVFETHFSAVENGGTRESIIPIDTDIFVWLECGEVVTGKISDIDGWKLESDTYNYELSEIQSWQPIGTWLDF